MAAALTDSRHRKHLGDLVVADAVVAFGAGATDGADVVLVELSAV